MGQRQVYRYSGAATYDAGAIVPVLARVRSVRVTHGGWLAYAVDPAADVLADSTEKYVSVLAKDGGRTVDDPDQVAELVAALTVDAVTDFSCMCAGDLALELFDADGTLISVVRVDMPRSLSWPHWHGDARLTDPDRLHAWLAAHGLWGDAAES